jgi:hypothetical protein
MLQFLLVEHEEYVMRMHILNNPIYKVISSFSQLEYIDKTWVF